jgi:hypothetical protein
MHTSSPVPAFASERLKERTLMCVCKDVCCLNAPWLSGCLHARGYCTSKMVEIGVAALLQVHSCTQSKIGHVCRGALQSGCQRYINMTESITATARCFTACPFSVRLVPGSVHGARGQLVTVSCIRQAYSATNARTQTRITKPRHSFCASSATRARYHARGQSGEQPQGRPRQGHPDKGH